MNYPCYPVNVSRHDAAGWELALPVKAARALGYRSPAYIHPLTDEIVVLVALPTLRYAQEVAKRAGGAAIVETRRPAWERISYR